MQTDIIIIIIASYTNIIVSR